MCGRLVCLIVGVIPLAAGGFSSCVVGQDVIAPQSVPSRFDQWNARDAWCVSPPLVAPLQRPGEICYSVKDPTVVYFEDAWHLFCTVRGEPRSHRIEYITFRDWDSVATARRELLRIHEGFFCAPQVFFFRPHQKWYLICQASDPSWQPEYGAAYATSTNLADPDAWSGLRPLNQRVAEGKSGLDFWVICDDEMAHLFFTTLDGRMWREETSLEDFPTGWSEPELAIKDDIFEASHTYRIRGTNSFLTLVEAQNGHGWRYYKAYLADRLDGTWRPLAATRDRAFASQANTQSAGVRWTDSISHGELLRAGFDERLEIDPAPLRFLFQGVSDAARADLPYGQIPWRLGLLEPSELAPNRSE